MKILIGEDCPPTASIESACLTNGDGALLAMTKRAAFGIKAKLIFAFTAVSLLTALIALFAIEQNIDGAETAALIEAEHMAMSLAYTGIDDVIIKNPQFL